MIVHGTMDQVEALAARHGVRIVRLMASGAVLELTSEGLDSVSQDPEVDHLSADMPVQRTMSVTTSSTGADQIWEGIESLAGMTGRGVGIAVIDSGIDGHPALRRRIVASVDFTSRRGRGQDAYGHGTHVAGIIAGASREFSGMAPGAHLINLRVLNEEGAGQASDVIDAIDWAIANRRQYGIRIINLSLGHGVVESYRDDPLCEAVERAVAAKILVVASAGNYGKLADGRAIIGGITSPGNSPWALTVGALNTRGTTERSDDVMATYSSRGPTYLDGIVKPDLVAPGNKVVSLGVPRSSLWDTYPQLQRSERGALFELSGTSMSAAVVSGAAALLLEANPRLTPLDVRLALQLSSTFLPEAGLVASGAGSLNVAAAMDLLDGRVDRQTLVAGQLTELSGLTYGPWSGQLTLPWANALIWGNTLVWGNTMIWGNSQIWSNTLVWGNTLIWGNTMIWGNTLVWGNTMIWGNAVNANTLVWGNTLIWGNALIWGSSVQQPD